MAKFYSVKVANIYKETKDCSVVCLDIPENLKQELKFSHGQHLTMRAVINGIEIRRSYSLCSSPIEGTWKVAVKKVNGGLFSSYVNEVLQKGDTLDIMAPNGVFFKPVNPDAKNYFIAFAAGSGITPILSIIKTHLALEPTSSFQLFYVNRSVKSIIFKEEIELLKNRYFGRFEVFHFLSKEKRDIPLFNGRFTLDKLKVLTSQIIDVPAVSDCFICGPEEMIYLVREALTVAGLSRDRIHFELFTSGISEDDKKRSASIVEKKVEGTEVTIIDGGKEFHFIMEEEYDNILDGALAAGADLPFACKGGVCSTCKCKVLEGTVEMKVNYALEEREVLNHYVLSCQAVPTAKKVVVDFDV